MTVGIVAEYDPFHRGHLYQMRQAREKTGAEYVVVVLGGDFLQRGMPSLVDKRARARMAVDAGADLVLALPYIYSVNSAREYALGAVRILAGTGCVEAISFGCETDDPEQLNSAASIMSREGELSPLIREQLSRGLSFPEAMTRSVEQLGGREAAEILRKPNNLLGCEYLRACRETGASLTPVPVRRLQSAASGSSGEPYLSASEIRQRIRTQGVLAALPCVPESTANVLRDTFPETDMPARFRDVERRMFTLLKYRLLTADRQELKRICLAGEGLENRLKAAVTKESVQTVSALADEVKTRRYTRARIMRILTHVLMDFREEDFQWLRGAGCARVLAFSDRGRTLLKKMRKTSSVPVLSNLARPDRYDARIRRILELEIRAAGLYRMLHGDSDLTGGEIRYVPYGAQKGT